MYLGVGSRNRFYGVLLLTLMFGLLPAPMRAELAVADDRVLRVHDGAAERMYAVPNLKESADRVRLHKVPGFCLILTALFGSMTAVAVA